MHPIICLFYGTETCLKEHVEEKIWADEKFNGRLDKFT
jgi:hypothetical protein